MSDTTQPTSHVFACRPADPDVRAWLEEQCPGIALAPHPGSVPGTCPACEAAVMIGPKQQAKIAEVTAAGQSYHTLCLVCTAAGLNARRAAGRPPIAVNVLPG